LISINARLSNFWSTPWVSASLAKVCTRSFISIVLDSSGKQMA
jgi:hypothetical protein